MQREMCEESGRVAARSDTQKLDIDLHKRGCAVSTSWFFSPFLGWEGRCRRQSDGRISGDDVSIVLFQFENNADRLWFVDDRDPINATCLFLPFFQILGCHILKNPLACVSLWRYSRAVYTQWHDIPPRNESLLPKNHFWIFQTRRRGVDLFRVRFAAILFLNDFCSTRKEKESCDAVRDFHQVSRNKKRERLKALE